jgi:hypothetical protein
MNTDRPEAVRRLREVTRSIMPVGLRSKMGAG